jgi:Protein of unknown function DUF262/Protein of unknown function (DUF1524)
MARSKSPIGFDHLGLGSVLTRNRLVVPPNQREYSWTKKHVIDLLTDFSKALGNTKKSYFLGTIVLTTTPDEALEVIDGQQRLATTTILIAAIRDFMLGRNEDVLVNSIEQDFLFKVIREKKKKSPRLTLNHQDKDYFVARILERPNSKERQKAAPTKSSHDLMDQASKLAAVHVERILSQHSKDNAIPVLNEWLSFIEHSAQVITLLVPDDLNAYVMFETLNDRGLKTSQADLVKNYLYGEANGQLHDAQMRWGAMTSLLEALDIDEIALTYLRHFAISQYGHTREKDVLERIKEKVSGEGSALAFLNSLAEHANDYVAILTPTHAKWNKFTPSTRDRLRTLRDLRVTILRPVLLAVARRFAKADAEHAIRLFVCWSVRFLIVGGGRSGSVEEACAEIARKITDGTIATAPDLIDAMKRVVPSDAEFEAAFATARVAQNGLARYYLRALELKRTGSAEPEFIPNEDIVINLEHVVPENPGNNWPDFDSDTAPLFHTRLGNMVLLQATKNALIGNSDFETKREVLKDSAFILTSEVGKSKKWRKEEINQRQKRLAKTALETWPLS